jgi:uncharacterized hydrophobic protein (TIGR00271 family)
MLIDLTSEERQRVISDLHHASAPNLSFAILIMLSTAIAAFGLLANSTAVVIGAMLIAPLMGPIFGITLSLIRGERRFLFSALAAEALGVVMAVGLAVLIGLIPLRPELGSEILSRTQPTLFDLLIALFSGFAGAFAILNPRVSPTIAGVAIATALVPPLAACGLCLSGGHWRLGFGAFLLFFVNFLAIQFSAAVVFLLANIGERPGSKGSGRLSVFLLRFGPGLAMLLVLGVFLTKVLVGIVTQRRIEARLSASLARLLGTSQGAQLNASHFAQKDGAWEYIAEVVTPQQFEPAVVGQFEDELAGELHRKVHLILRSLISRDYDRAGPVFISDSEREGLTARQAQAELLQQVSAGLTRGIKDVDGASLTDLRRDESAPGLSFTAVVQSPTIIEPDKVAQLTALLQRQLGQQVGLVVRTILTHDADSTRYVYVPAASAPQPTPEQLAFQALLEGKIRQTLPGIIGGTVLTAVQFSPDSAGTQVTAQVTAPRTVTPGEVGKLQDALRAAVRPDIRLVVQTTVQASASAEGYVVAPPPPAAPPSGDLPAGPPAPAKPDAPATSGQGT